MYTIEGAWYCSETCLLRAHPHLTACTAPAPAGQAPQITTECAVCGADILGQSWWEARDRIRVALAEIVTSINDEPHLLVIASVGGLEDVLGDLALAMPSWGDR